MAVAALRSRHAILLAIKFGPVRGAIVGKGPERFRPVQTNDAKPEIIMKERLILTLAAFFLAAGSAVAQAPEPGQDRSAPTATATPAQKAIAKAARRAEGSAVAKSDQPGDDRPATNAKAASKSERLAAAAKRKAEGAKTARQPKEVTGTNQ